MSVPRLLVTGPTHALPEYSNAARLANWEPVDYPLLEVIECSLTEGLPFEGLPDRMILTSRNALGALDGLCAQIPELKTVPLDVVGEKTKQLALERGFRVEGRAADGAATIASRLSNTNTSRILWPRGSVSDRLGEELREQGHDVFDPIVYETRRIEQESPPPDAHAAFFASPSAFRAWMALEQARPADRTIAVAIGDTTASAIQAERAVRFFDILSLPHPAPEALTWRLENLGYSPPD